MKETTYQNLSKREQKLVDKAERTMKKAYAPYSHFLVGAALLTKQGKIFTGANFENANFSSTLHAEQIAVGTAASKGFRKFQSIAVIAAKEESSCKEPNLPCGECLQVLAEVAQLSNYDLKVIASNTKKSKIKIALLTELYPESFGVNVPR